MNDGKFVLPDSKTITISSEAVDKLISGGSGDAALLYLCILSGGGIFSREAAARAIHRTPQQVDAAMSVLARLGLVKGEVQPALQQADELPEYTAADINRELENGTAFKELSREVQAVLCKMLSSDDLVKLFGIYDYLGLPAEVILLLVNHCAQECAARYGASRRPTMRYVEKAAYQWEKEGLFTLEAAEAYLARCHAIDSKAAAFAAAMQIKGRALTVSERRYIEEWISMGFTPEAVGEAYDRTVLKTGKLAWGYMNSIMKSWHSKGLHTPDEIAAGDRKSTPVASKTENRKGPTAEDIARNRRALERVKGDK